MLEDDLPKEPYRGPTKPKGKNGILLPLGRFFKDDVYESLVISCQSSSSNGLKNRHVGAAICFALDYHNSNLCDDNKVDENLIAFYKNMRFAEILLSKKRSAQVVNWKLHSHALRDLQAKLDPAPKLYRALIDLEEKDQKTAWRRDYVSRGVTSGGKVHAVLSAWLELKAACKVKISPLYHSEYNNITKTAVLERLILAKKPHFRALAEQHARRFLEEHSINKSIFENQNTFAEGDIE